MPAPRPYFDCEEVCSHDQFPVLREKLFPGCLSAPLRRRLDAIPLQNLSDRVGRNLVTQVEQGALDSPIAIPVLLCELHYQSLDLVSGFWTSRSPLGSAVIFVGDQFPPPGPQSLGRNKRGHFSQKLPTQTLGLGGQATALVVVESHSPSGDLLAQDSVFLAKVLDDL